MKTGHLEERYVNKESEVVSLNRENVLQDDALEKNKKRSNSTVDNSILPNDWQDDFSSKLNVITIRPKKKDKIVINLKYTEYEILETVAKELGFKITKSNKIESDILWFDLPINSTILAKMRNFQRVNHFPGTGQMANKSNLAKNLMRMLKLHPNSYSFFPMTWLLPSDLHELK